VTEAVAQEARSRLAWQNAPWPVEVIASRLAPRACTKRTRAAWPASIAQCSGCQLSAASAPTAAPACSSHSATPRHPPNRVTGVSPHV